MDIHIHIEKKHLYVILSVFILALGTMFVFGAHGTGSPPAWNIGNTYHFLQDVAKDDTKASVDANNNGVIDDSEGVTCVGCVDSVDILDNTILSGDINDGQIYSADIRDNDVLPVDVGFNYAASPSKGGPANNSLECTADATCEMQAGSTTGNFNIGGSGSVVGSVTANAFFYSSDILLKRNISSIPNALNGVQQLHGVYFDWKKDGRRDIGLVAQEVEIVYPELVSTDLNGYKTVEYGNLVAVLVEAIKEQQKEIDELKLAVNACSCSKN